MGKHGKVKYPVKPVLHLLKMYPTRELAENLGLSKDIINRWKNGSRPGMRAVNADKVACFFGEHMSAFWDDYNRLDPLELDENGEEVKNVCNN